MHQGLAWNLGRVLARRIPGLRSCVILVWRGIGSLKFRAAYQDACARGDVRLHIGSGFTRHDGWLNTDILPSAPLFLDATRHFPVKDNSVRYILCEHFLEHIPRHVASQFLKESFRVLHPEGILRISTPDVEALAREYLARSERALLLLKRNGKIGSKYSRYPVDILNTAFYDYSHVYLYDGEVLEQMLRSVGFQDITRYRVGESRHRALSGIERHDVGSIEDEFTLVIEAKKPLL